MKKTITLASALVAIIVALVFLSSCGTTTVVKEVPATTIAPPITQAPVINKYDAYLEHVYNNSGQANSMSKAKLIEYGDIICSVLDQGKTIPWIVNYLSNGSNTQSDNELYASIVYGAITYICDEYKYALNEYLAGV